MIFDPKRGGVVFDPPPNLPRKLQKGSFNWGVSKGVQTKNSLGNAFIGQNNDFVKG